MTGGQDLVNGKTRDQIRREGKCRFNCRTQREAFVAGFKEAVSNTNYRACDAEAIYREWKRRQTTTDVSSGRDRG